jgi:hypothetical protein
MELTASEVGARIGFSEGKVKKHMSAKGFATARLDHLVRYAGLFAIPVAKLFALSDPFDRSFQLDFQPTSQPAVSVLTISASTARPPQ